MPAVNEIDADDFHKIMNNRLFDFWLVRTTFGRRSRLIFPFHSDQTRPVDPQQRIVHDAAQRPSVHSTVDEQNHRRRNGANHVRFRQ